MRRFLVARLVCGLILTGLLTPVVAISAHGQESTPTVGLPRTPGPGVCIVEPRPLASFEQYVGTPAAPAGDESAMTGATPEAFVPPAGDPADAETVQGVTVTAIEIVACYNAGDLRRAYALYTDRFLEELAAQEPLPQETFAVMAATPQPVPEEQWSSILAVRDVVILPDGRAAAAVDFEFEGGYQETQYVIMAQVGERWLVDEILHFAPLEATPAP